MSKVKISSCCTSYHDDLVGFFESCLPPLILFTHHALDLGEITDLDLGLELISYADGNTLISTGNLIAAKLENNVNFAVDNVYYITIKKKRMMKFSKQMYIIFLDVNDEEDHNNLYFDVVLKNQKRKKI